MQKQNETKKGDAKVKGKYLNPKADLTFKLVFGEHKDLTMSFLNALLPLAEDAPITSIEYETPEMSPERDGGKNSVVDVRCTDARGRRFIVEMQMSWLFRRLLTIINEQTDEVPAELMENEQIRKALSIVEKSAMTENQLYNYERFWDQVNRELVLAEGNFNDGLVKGRAEGEAKGKAEGIAEGEIRKNLENARKMKSKGYPADDIADITGLTREEIENL